MCRPVVPSILSTGLLGFESGEGSQKIITAGIGARALSEAMLSVNWTDERDDHANVTPIPHRGLRERKEEMEQRSSRRIRELVTRTAQLEAYPLIRSNARSYP